MTDLQFFSHRCIGVAQKLCRAVQSACATPLSPPASGLALQDHAHQVQASPDETDSNPKIARNGIWLTDTGLGWPTGLEPATTRTTIWGSTIELRPPTMTRNKILRFQSPFANPVSVWLSVWTVTFFSFRRGQRERTKEDRLLSFAKQRTRLSQVTPLIVGAGGTKICLQLDCRLGLSWRGASCLDFSRQLVFPSFDNSAFGAAGRSERDFS